MMKSTILCFNIDSVWKLVIKNEISYPYTPALHLSIPTENRNQAERNDLT